MGWSLWVGGLVYSGEICKSSTKMVEKVEGCGDGGREVAVVGESEGGADGEMKNEEGKEEEEDKGVGVKFEMEGEIWVVEEGKMGIVKGKYGQAVQGEGDWILEKGKESSLNTTCLEI